MVAVATLATAARPTAPAAPFARGHKCARQTLVTPMRTIVPTVSRGAVTMSPFAHAARAERATCVATCNPHEKRRSRDAPRAGAIRRSPVGTAPTLPAATVSFAGHTRIKARRASRPQLARTGATFSTTARRYSALETSAVPAAPFACTILRRHRRCPPRRRRRRRRHRRAHCRLPHRHPPSEW